MFISYSCKVHSGRMDASDWQVALFSVMIHGVRFFFLSCGSAHLQHMSFKHIVFTCIKKEVERMWSITYEKSLRPRLGGAHIISIHIPLVRTQSHSSTKLQGRPKEEKMIFGTCMFISVVVINILHMIFICALI